MRHEGRVRLPPNTFDDIQMGNADSRRVQPSFEALEDPPVVPLRLASMAGDEGGGRSSAVAFPVDEQLAASIGKRFRVVKHLVSAQGVWRIVHSDCTMSRRILPDVSLLAYPADGRAVSPC